MMYDMARSSARRGSYRPPAAPRWKPTGEMRRSTASSMRQLASNVQKDHPEMGMHVHIRDAASALDRGNTEAAVRHLNAAIGMATPQSIRRHGIIHDEDYHAAKAHMHEVHRHLLLVREIQDHDAHNASLTGLSQDATDEADTGMSAVPSSREPKAMRPGEKEPSGGPDASVAAPKSVTSWHVTKQVAASNGDLTTAIDMSAETGRLAVTPAPRGRPGGPGLYNVKGNAHSAYFQQVVKALIEKRGMPPSKAYPIAWSALRRWRRGGGGVHPEVRAAAAGALGQEDVARARAHSHANGETMSILLTWEDADRAIELAVLDLVGPGGWSHNYKREGQPGFDPKPHGYRGVMPGKGTGHYDSKGKWSQTQAERSRALFGAGGSPRHDFFPNATGKKGGIEAGSKEHAGHLRKLASQADNRALSKGGSESEVGNRLRNAARRVEQGNFRAAKLHMVGLGNAEHREHNAGSGPGNADMHRAVHEARNSVMRLPDKGPAMSPPSKVSADEARRTAAARAYAARQESGLGGGAPLLTRKTAASKGELAQAARTRETVIARQAAPRGNNQALLRQLARNRRRNAGLSNRDALAILLAGGVPGPKG